MYKSFVLGYLRGTGSKLPDSEKVHNSARIVGCAHQTFHRIDSNPDSNLEFEEIQEFIQANEFTSLLFSRFEPKSSIKETLRTLDKFPKISSKQFSKLYKEAISVIAPQPHTIISPEDFLDRILRMGNKKIPYLPIVKEKRRPLKGLSTSRGENADLSGEKSLKLPTLGHKKSNVIDLSDPQQDSSAYQKEK